LRSALLLAATAALAACAPDPTEPLLVGPGPCGDTAGYVGVQIVEGCAGVLLVEATATVEPDGIAVEGRALTAGSLVPVEGAHVVPVGGSAVVVTDGRGRFALSGLRASDRLVVRLAGMWPDTLEVGRLPGPRDTGPGYEDAP
jgi:hypothetical protein